MLNIAIQVECFVAVKEPESNTHVWIESRTAQIRVKSMVNCNLIPEIKLAWKHVTLDNQIKTLSATSSVLTLTYLSQNESGKYYYEVLRAIDSTVIYTSSKTTTFYVSCELYYFFSYLHIGNLRCENAIKLKTWRYQLVVMFKSSTTRTNCFRKQKMNACVIEIV